MEDQKTNLYDCYFARRFLMFAADFGGEIEKVRESYRFVAQCEKSLCSERMKASCRAALQDGSCYDNVYKVCKDIISLADEDTINKAKFLTVRTERSKT